GGAVSAIITSLKNNVRKRKTIYDSKAVFDKRPGKKVFITDKKATPEQLEAIRNRLKRERRMQTLRTLFVTFTVLILLLLFFIWANGQLKYTV
ncbi:MAG: hypothetical protein KDD04_09375, partial [Sinomicrobium sp.]|nr:hypothetical protein [Sinomicrobium sp.]